MLREWCPCGTMSEPLTTTDVCRTLEISEPALRHLLRRPGAPRSRLHPSAHIFLWTEDDLRRVARFLGAENSQTGRRTEAGGDS